MVGWKQANAVWKSKSCAVCGTVFTPKSGRHKFCTESCKGKWKYITGSMTTEVQYKLISGNWSRYISRLLYCGGRRRDLLTREVLLARLEKQNYLCALSGVPLTCELSKGVTCNTNASVDRIIPGGSYTPDNIQLVCVVLNNWRYDTTIAEFIRWCKKVAEYNSDRTT